MVCNEANLNLFLSLEQKIVVSQHNELAVVPLAQLVIWESTGQWRACVWIYILNIIFGLFVQ